MKRAHRKLAARLFLTLLALLVAVPVGLTWRVARQQHLNRALIEAAKRGDDQESSRLLEQGADPNCRDWADAPVSPWRMMLDLFHGKHGAHRSKMEALTPLLYAVFWSKDAVSDTSWSFTEVFLRLTAQAEAGRPIPNNPALVRALLEHGADVNVEL